MFENKKISIIIPSLNSGETIGRALRKAHSQQDIDIELIIIDGGSTDSTCEIVKEYQQKHHNIILISEADQGIYDAMNKGIDASSGDWLYFMGADDELYDENVLSDLYDSELLEQQKIVYGNVVINGSSNWANDGDIYDGPFDLKKLLTKNICQQAIFYPRRVFEKHGKFDLYFKVIADWDFNLRCFAHEEFLYWDRNIARFATGGKSSTPESDQNRIELIKRVSKYFDKDLFNESTYNPESVFFDFFKLFLNKRLKLNLNKENIKDGISLFTAVKNRSDLLEEALKTWITHPEIDEIVIVDWSSNEPLHPLIEKYQNGKIILVQIENQNHWVLSKAFNIAAKYTSFNKILKLDSDVKLYDGFFDYHILTQGSFISGDWRIGRNENETHLCGNLFIYRNDFIKSGGYNENFTTYGYDDSDLYNRLNELGLEQQFFNYDFLYHIEHHGRMSNQQLPELFKGLNDEEWARFNILKNRSLSRNLKNWSWESDCCNMNILEITENHSTGEIEDVTHSDLTIEIVKLAENVAVHDRLIELNVFNYNFLKNQFSDEQLFEIYYMNVRDNDQHTKTQLEIFNKFNEIQYQSNLEKIGLENEIDLLKHLIELKEKQSNQQDEEIQALNNTINERNSLIEKNNELIKNSLEQIINFNHQIDLNNKVLTDSQNQIQALNDQILKLHDEIRYRENIIESVTNQNEAIRNSLTFKAIRLSGLIVGIFHPISLFSGIKKNLTYNRECRIIRESPFFDATYYLHSYPDVASSGMNLAKHYLLYGGFEGRNPSDQFDSSYYLSSYQDVAKSGINPLLHYLLHGKNEGRTARRVKQEIENIIANKSVTTDPSVHSLNENRPEPFLGLMDEFQQQVYEIRESGMFDADYYYSEYPDVRNAEMDALEHYCMYGWHEGRNPNPTFETYYYLSVHKDVKESGTNPLLHYVVAGHKEGRQTQFIDSTNSLELTFEKPAPFAFNKTQSPVKTIAFYLPQFHPIPENDEWWGRNFTEWTNVTRAKPQFEGHYQPHLPLDLGFYDLRIPEVMRQQIEMAKSFGINGFCFYYYWFGGKRLLEKPLDMFLEHKEWNFDFCMCWANENWTRRWDGQEKDVLIAQQHSPEDDIAFIDDIAKYILDPRYIKVDGKPMVIIYQPQIFPEIKATVKRWREHVKNNYGIEIYLTMVQTFGRYDPAEFDFDAAIEFPPHNVVPDMVTDIETNVEFIGTIHDAKSLLKASKEKLSTVNYDLFRGVMLNWDNTARKGRKSNVFVNNDPITYKEWLEEAIQDTLTHKSDDAKKMVFINAWNEWAEGTHLEPDQKYGYAYLNATSRALESSSILKNKLKIGVLIHAFYLDIIPELLTYTDNIKEDFTILLSVPIGKKSEALSILNKHNCSKFIIKEVENIGFDIAPMICSFQAELFEFDLICKIHTKKSTHNSSEFGMEWRQFCLNYLLQDEHRVRKIINEFNINDDLGIIYPPGYPPVLDWIKKNGANLNQIEKILPESLVPSSYKNLAWPMGSFFWFRPAALQPIFDENFTLQDFEPKDFSLFDDNGTVRDLTLAHSIERVFCYVARSSGYKTYQLANTLFDDKLAFPSVYHKKGFCPVCNAETIFFSPDDWYRDHLHCKNCNSIPRNRALFHVLNSIDPNWRSKRVHESSPNNKYIADVVSDYTFSQFYPDEKLGKMIDGNRNENLEKLTFHNGEFDYFFTLDVLEHVFNPGIAIKEMLRVVNDNGAVVFTVPIHKHYEISVQRAKLDKNNKTIHLMPENYHGNPVGDGKSLVTWDYGQDFKNIVQGWIGKSYEISIFNEPNEPYGIIGDYLEVIVIRKGE